MTTSRRHRYKVGVRKEYFDRQRWPEGFTSYVEIHIVIASSRVEAAAMVWKRNGRRLLKEMMPNRRKVSLDVNDPVVGVCGNLGRLIPVTVWTAGDIENE